MPGSAGRLSLQHRIVLPFAAVALVGTTAAAWVALSVSSQALETRVRTQIRSTATAVARSDFALNPAVLRNVQQIVGAEVITFGADGAVLASSLEGPGDPELVRVTREAAVTVTLGVEPTVVALDCGTPCLVAFHAVQGRDDALVAIVADTSPLADSTAAVTRAILFAAGASLLVMVFVSQFVARRVTAPLDRLVRFARDVSPGTTSQRAEVGDDEAGRLAQAFNDMLDRLDRSQQALVRSEKLGLAGLLAARVAHDIRNPLSSIKMQTQLLKARLTGDAEDQETLAAVLRDIVQVESVIRDLIELARPGELRRRPCSVNTVARDALEQVAHQLAHRRIAVATHLDEGLPQVPLDEPRFRQALLNVIVNAAEAMTSGGTLEVSSRRSAGDEGIELEVADDGAGIDPAILARVFDPFVSTKRDGVGLGLVNARSVVEAHGGSLLLDHRQPRGTRAVFRLPLEHVESPESHG
ncbi:MAG: PAS domain-containing sensor histidine kinase [Vicinamibacterales bacterium]